MNSLRLKLKNQILAKTLIEKGARPSVVRAVCQLPKLVAVQLYKEINGVQPSAGLLPYDPEWVMKKPENCIDASVYYNIYTSLLKKTKSDSTRRPKGGSRTDLEAEEAGEILLRKGEIYLNAYTIYEQTVVDSKFMNINRAWHVTQQISMNSIASIPCPICKSMHVSVNDYPDMFKLCPICSSFTDNAGRIKWKMPSSMTRTRAPNKKKPIDNPNIYDQGIH